MMWPSAPVASADGRGGSHFSAHFHLSFDALRCVPWAFLWRHSFEHRCCCSGPAHLLCLRVILPPQRLVMHVGTASRSRDTSGSTMLILLKVIVVRAPRGHAPAAVGTKLFGTSAKWMRYVPSLSALLERIACLPARLHASSVLAGCSALIVRKSDYQPCTLAHLNAVLPDAG